MKQIVAQIQRVGEGRQIVAQIQRVGGKNSCTNSEGGGQIVAQIQRMGGGLIG